MCVVETARGCWSYLCQECQEDIIVRDAHIENMKRALAAVLMFHGGAYWDKDAVERWHNLTGSEEATSRVLCDVARAALAEEAGRLRHYLALIAEGQHGEYCGDANARLTLGGKTVCYRDCPVLIARRAIAETKEARP